MCILDRYNQMYGPIPKFKIILNSFGIFMNYMCDEILIKIQKMYLKKISIFTILRLLLIIEKLEY